MDGPVRERLAHRRMLRGMHSFRSLCSMNAESAPIGRRPRARGSDGVTAHLSGIQLPQTCRLQTDDPLFDRNGPLVCGRYVVRAPSDRGQAHFVIDLGADHHRQKRVIDPGFGPAQLRQFYSVFQSKAAKVDFDSCKR